MSGTGPGASHPAAPHELPGGYAPGAHGPGAGDYRVSRRSGGLLSTLFVLIAIAAGVSLVPLPYVIFGPGPITNTLGRIDGKPIIEISGATSHPAKGSLDFTTVRVVGGPGVRVNAFDLAVAALRSDQEIFSRDEIYPQDVSRKQVEEESAAEMVDSQEVAAAVALRETGRTVPEHVVVSQLPKGSPARGVLEAGDRLVSVDGRPAEDSAAVQKAVRSHRAGDTVPVVVQRKGRTLSLSVPTRDNAGTTVIGVLLGRDYDLPVDVHIAAGDVGGPSAGTMFTLAVYDLLTPGDLTGGRRIAGTGTMQPDESVGPIGGIRQKLAGARNGGADYFLAPADNCSEVRGHVPDGLRVVRIGTFDDALAGVRSIASGDVDRLPDCG